MVKKVIWNCDFCGRELTYTTGTHVINGEAIGRHSNNPFRYDACKWCYEEITKYLYDKKKKVIKYG